MTTERIMIVEDEIAVARGLEYALQVERFEVFCAADGRSASGLASTLSPHLILLDLRLPDISGFDVCRQLHQDGFRQPIASAELFPWCRKYRRVLLIFHH